MNDGISTPSPTLPLTQGKGDLQMGLGSTSRIPLDLRMRELERWDGVRSAKSLWTLKGGCLKGGMG